MTMPQNKIHLAFSAGPESFVRDGQNKPDDALFNHGDGGSGGGSMDNRVTRLETVYEQQQKTLMEIRDDLRSMRNDVISFERSSRGDSKELERRLIDRIDENHKWVMGLIISSIIVPLLVALLTK